MAVSLTGELIGVLDKLKVQGFTVRFELWMGPAAVLELHDK